MAVALALAASLMYGVSDFVGGLASRRDRAVVVLVVSYPVGLALMAVLLPLDPGRLAAAAFGWAAGAGACGAAGVVLLYRGLAAGPMGVVAPLAALASAVVPVGIGIALGERPPAVAYLGVVLALLSVALVSRAEPGRGPGEERAAVPVTAATVVTALAAGSGFGLYFALLARTPGDSGMWPLLVSRGIASLAMLAAVAGAGSLRRPAAGVLPLALVAGTLDAAANAAYLVAVRHGMLALVAVLVALYPASTITLAAAVLRERTGAAQRVGLAAAAAAVALIALNT
jgi:drug/metabolite transporter (DMT)-like permease